jgi:hypothetical protein
MSYEIHALLRPKKCLIMAHKSIYVITSDKKLVISDKLFVWLCLIKKFVIDGEHICLVLPDKNIYLYAWLFPIIFMARLKAC